MMKTTKVATQTSTPKLRRFLIHSLPAKFLNRITGSARQRSMQKVAKKTDYGKPTTSAIYHRAEGPFLVGKIICGHFHHPESFEESQKA